MTPKGITGLYVEMFRKLDITTIQQAKKLTQDEYGFFQIRPEHHKWRYAHMAIKHINKTSPKTKPSLNESPLEQYREQMLADIIKRIESLPDSDPYKASLISTRELIEEQIKPPKGTA